MKEIITNEIDLAGNLIWLKIYAKANKNEI